MQFFLRVSRCCLRDPRALNFFQFRRRRKNDSHLFITFFFFFFFFSNLLLRNGGSRQVQWSSWAFLLQIKLLFLKLFKLGTASDFLSIISLLPESSTSSQISKEYLIFVNIFQSSVDFCSSFNYKIDFSNLRELRHFHVILLEFHNFSIFPRTLLEVSV